MAKAINDVGMPEVERKTISDLLGGDRVRSAVFRINYIQYESNTKSTNTEKRKDDIIAKILLRHKRKAVK